MALGNGPRAFPIDGMCTLADLRAIVAQTQDEPDDSEVRVNTRAGMSRYGAAIRQVNLVRPRAR